MFSFIPSNTKFYDHFNRIAEILVKAAERFQEFTSMPEHVARRRVYRRLSGDVADLLPLRERS